MNNNVEIPRFYKSPRKEYSKEIKLYNAGWVAFYDYMGDDLTPLIAARMSTGNPTGEDRTKDAGSRSYLWRKGHVSPFEQAFMTIVLQVPITVARQFVRHRGIHINEFSMRYSGPLHEYYIPEPESICYDNEHNKQSSGGPVSAELAEEFINDCKSDVILHKAKYEKYRKLGIAKERVRDFQPVSSYTRIIATANLRDWFFYLHKRLKPDAQFEIQKLSWAIYEMLKDLYPLSCEVFEEFTLNAESFSRTDIEVVRDLIMVGIGNNAMESDMFNEDYFDGYCQNNGLNKTRTRELKQKLKLFSFAN